MANDSISMEELLFTYRKVKRELFYEKDYIRLNRILLFEENIEDKLSHLLSILEGTESEVKSFINNPENIGTGKFIFKDISFDDLSKPAVKKSIKNLERNLFKIKEIDFRFIGDISIYFQIIGGLWLNRIGYKLDRKFPSNVYGCRLKKCDDSLNLPYYRQNDTLYKPYFNDYKKWQNDLFKSIEIDKDVLVITSDLKKYYHSIELEELKCKVEELCSELELTKIDLLVNKLLFQMLEKFNELNNGQYQSFFQQNNLDSKKHGLPLTLNVSRVLANIYLLELDKDILENLKPLYYGRYVDDIIIALENIGFDNEELDLKNILKPLKTFLISEDGDLTYKDGTVTSVKFNSEKEHIFIFNAKEDITEINQLKKSINKTSSEWKLMPDNSDYDDVENMDLFHELNRECKDVNGLRKSSGLILKRNKFIKEIVGFETFICSYDRNIWQKRLNNFLNIIENYIFDFKNFVDLSKYIPRLFGLIIHSNNEVLIKRYFENLSSVLKHLKEQSVYQTYLENAKCFLNVKIGENILTSNSLDKINSEYAHKWLKEKAPENLIKKDTLYNVQLFFNVDLHKIPYKETYYKFKEFKKYKVQNISESKIISLRDTFFDADIFDFIDRNNGIVGNIASSTGFFFFTRRLSLLELTITFKNSVIEEDRGLFRKLAEKYYHKYEISVNDKYEGVDTLNFIDFTNTNTNNNPSICNTHFFTDNNSFDSTVRQFRLDADKSRYDRLIGIVNNIIKDSRNINYAVFHELCLPRNIYVQIARKLSLVGVNLIAGLEYKFHGKTADNQLVYVLNCNHDKRDSVALYQSKIIGAIHESDEIRRKKDLTILPKYMNKLIIKHCGFIFSGLICNDMLDINNRAVLRGNIDTLFVIAWNQDLETYQHLVNSACLDIHCFLSICNNKVYGDTRIRAPYKDSWMRDIQKIHGGELDTFIISKLDIQGLRDFQTNHIAPEKPFKPLPTGFEISPERQRI